MILKNEKQAGSVLIISLVILLVLTVLGVSGMGTTVLQERMASNTQDLNSAFQAAESGLRDGEADILANITASTTFTAACTNGRCEPVTTGTDAWNDSTLVNWDASTNTISYGSGTGSSYISGTAAEPQYILERMQTVPRGSALSSTNVDFWYRVTAVGYGKHSQSRAANSSEVMLQSVYRP